MPEEDTGHTFDQDSDDLFEAIGARPVDPEEVAARQATAQAKYEDTSRIAGFLSGERDVLDALGLAGRRSFDIQRHAKHMAERAAGEDDPQGLRLAAEVAWLAFQQQVDEVGRTLGREGGTTSNRYDILREVECETKFRAEHDGSPQPLCWEFASAAGALHLHGFIEGVPDVLFEVPNKVRRIGRVMSMLDVLAEYALWAQVGRPR
jgi:hypothetical protein